MAHIAPCRSFFTIAATPSTWTCVHNFFTNLKPYLGLADKNVGVFSSHFMHYHLDMRSLEGNTTYSAIFNFFCNSNNCRSVTFQHPRAGNYRMLRPRANKNFTLFFLCKENFVWLFHAKIKLCVFFLWYNVCNNFFFLSSVSATKISMKVLRIETK